jgi:hypothetical protein
MSKMKSYVYEDVRLPNGWTAMIEVMDECDEFSVVTWMACNPEGTECSESKEYSGEYPKETRERCEAIDKHCCEWLSSIMERGPVADHHAAYRRKLAARRRLIADVESTRTPDAAITGQTAELVRRPVVSLADELLAGERRRFDDTNNDSPDADWRDEVRHG